MYICTIRTCNTTHTGSFQHSGNFQVCNILAKAMWDRIPASEIMEQSRAELANIERNKRLKQACVCMFVCICVCVCVRKYVICTSCIDMCLRDHFSLK